LAVDNAQIAFWRIREFRKSARLTLEDLAVKTGFTRSYISKIERGEAVPAIGAALKIADALNVSVNELIGGRLGANSCTIVRGGEPPVMDIDGTGEGVWQALTTLPVQGAVDVFFVYPVIKGSQADLMRPDNTHRGREMFSVLAGEIEFTLNNEMVSVLKTGDNVVFDASFPHRVRTLGAEQAKLLVVVTKNH